MQNWYQTRDAVGINHRGIDISAGKKIFLNEAQAQLYGEKVEKSDPPQDASEAGVAGEWSAYQKESVELARGNAASQAAYSTLALSQIKTDDGDEVVNTAIRDGEETSPSLAVKTPVASIDKETKLDTLPDKTEETKSV